MLVVDRTRKWDGMGWNKRRDTNQRLLENRPSLGRVRKVEEVKIVLDLIVRRSYSIKAHERPYLGVHGVATVVLVGLRVVALLSELSATTSWKGKV